MTRIPSIGIAAALALAAVLCAVVPATAADSRVGFGFDAPVIAGNIGSVFLTGGGAYDPINVADGSFVHSGGGFRCLETVVGSVPLNGCLAGQGVRWDTNKLLPGTGFLCTGDPREVKKTAATGDRTVVLLADFYRAGDGNEESFKAKMIVSEDPIATDLHGEPLNVWIQGVGCGAATVHFGS